MGYSFLTGLFSTRMSALHCVVMSLSHGFQLNSVAELRHPAAVFDRLMELICRLASYGLIHCDFNEFNLLVDDEENVTMIDFPQMVSTSHINAKFYFDRDVNGVATFFKRRFNFEYAVPRAPNPRATEGQIVASA